MMFASSLPRRKKWPVLLFIGMLLCGAIHQIPAASAPAAGSPKASATPAASPTPAPTPIVPLYKRYPPETVVVGEVGSVYILTRRDLEKMVGNPISPALLAQRDSDPFIAAEIERQMSKVEEQVLWDWALLKTIALLARNDGITVTDAELDAHLEKLNRELVPAAVQTGTQVAEIVDPQTFRSQMRDALLVDKAILMQVEKMFPEEFRRDMYNRQPELFSTPASMRVWHIYKIIPPAASAEEIRDIRRDFYQVRRRAARSGGNDFQKIALEVNPFIAGKPNDGDMGWIDANSGFPPEIMETLEKLKTGDVSDIVHVKGESGVMGRSVMDLFQPGARPAPAALDSPGSFQIFRITEREPAKGVTYDDYARQRVLDKLMDDFKNIMGRPIMRSAPFPIRMNSSGVRLIHEPSRK